MKGSATARIGVWNSEWAGPRSSRGIRIIQQLANLKADILCVTEGCRDLLPQDGSIIDSQPDYGYPVSPGRRKVLLWSRQAWILEDRIGSEIMPGGRFVSGVTETPLGYVTVLGVCIPWNMAHVTTGRKDRNPWEDHLLYLEGLQEVLGNHVGQPLIVVGDFNQTVPRNSQPRQAFDELNLTLEGLVEIATAGNFPELDGQLIDHVAHSADFEPVAVSPFSRLAPDGFHLSDHHGVVVDLAARR